MKVLANPDLILNQHQIVQTLPHLAIELFDIENADKVSHNDTLYFNTPEIDFKVIIFKPGDGTRFVLKSFVIYSDVVLQKQSFLLKVFKLFRTNPNIKTQGKLLFDITNFLYEAGADLLKHSYIQKPLE